MTITIDRTKKFDNFRTDSLVRMVQQSHLKLEELKKDKKLDLRKEERILGSMRSELIDRLEKMNRLNPEFFPLRSIVGYSADYRDDVIKKSGVVVGHNKDHVQVQFSGEIGQVLVEPAYIKLRFIRR